MPISYRIDNINRRIYTRAEGLVTYEELFRHMNADVGPDAAAYYEIFDCTGATTNLSMEEVRKLALERQRIAQGQEPGPVAVVATTNVFFGMLRMFDVLTSTLRPIRIFRDINEAEKWLDTIKR